MQFSLDTVQAVTRLLRESDLAEISLESTDGDSAASRLTVRRQAPLRGPRRQPPVATEYSGTGVESEVSTVATSNGATASSNTPDNSSAAAEDNDTVLISATAVGVFRSAQPPLKAGDAVKSGQVVGIVESLKIPNEVIAPVAAQIVEVLSAEGSAVEYGQPLFLLNPIQ